MNIQIYGKPKCFETKKAERYFKERGISYQSIDVVKYGMSKGEFNSVKQSVGDIGVMLDENARDKELLVLLKYLSPEASEEKLFENQKLLKTPIVRNGKKATVGYYPEIWKTWE